MRALLSGYEKIRSNKIQYCAACARTQPEDVCTQPEDVLLQPEDVLLQPEDVCTQLQDVLLQPEDVCAMFEDVFMRIAPVANAAGATAVYHASGFFAEKNVTL
jgi:hypothetical protein